MQENDYQNCNRLMEPRKKSMFFEKLKLLCNNERSCTISIDIQNLLYYSITEKQSKACDQEAYMYMQIPCLYPKHQMYKRKIVGLMITCISVFIFLFMQAYLQYVKKLQANRFIDWDVKTISAADYTVEFAISKNQYVHWQNNYYDRSSPISEIGQFRIYVRQEME